MLIDFNLWQCIEWDSPLNAWAGAIIDEYAAGGRFHERDFTPAYRALLFRASFVYRICVSDFEEAG